MFQIFSIPDDLVPVVYRTVVEYGGDTEWNYFLKKFKSSNNDDERKSFLQALAYTKRDHLLKVLYSNKSKMSILPKK